MCVLCGRASYFYLSSEATLLGSKQGTSAWPSYLPLMVSSVLNLFSADLETKNEVGRERDTESSQRPISVMKTFVPFQLRILLSYKQDKPPDSVLFFSPTHLGSCRRTHHQAVSLVTGRKRAGYWEVIKVAQKQLQRGRNVFCAKYKLFAVNNGESSRLKKRKISIWVHTETVMWIYYFALTFKSHQVCHIATGHAWCPMCWRSC